jgi:hypothetical protein
LTIPVDITWQRLAYSRDMVDRSFKSARLPPKWRSSMTVWSYVVPEEQTAESYPGFRIVYLRFGCSLTGWNPNEELREAVDLDDVGDALDDLQHSSWQAMQSEGWADQYWPCLGAIAQLAVFPSEDDDVGPDDFPFIIEVEPKKRELYETRSETGEVLSGSSENVNVRKGATTTDFTEESNIISGGSASFGVGPVSFGASASGEWGTRTKTGTEAVDITTTDKSLDRRESTSATTTFSQLYQMMNAYHLGTNRCVFVVAPRPHTVSETAQVDFNLLDGHRKLEGIQDFFVIVQVPASLGGICVHASLDTGHTVRQSLGAIKLRPRDDIEIDDDDIPDYDPLPPEEPDDPLPPQGDDDESVAELLVITRRTIANCGRFDESGILVPVGADIVLPDGDGRPWIVGEGTVIEGVPDVVLTSRSRERDDPRRGQQTVADQRNRFQRRVSQTMLSSFTARRYSPRRFAESNAARTLTGLTLRRSTLTTDRLRRKGLVTRAELQAMGNPKTVGDIFGTAFMTTSGAELRRVLRRVRTRIVDFVLEPARPREPSDDTAPA